MKWGREILDAHDTVQPAAAGFGGEPITPRPGAGTAKSSASAGSRWWTLWQTETGSAMIFAAAGSRCGQTGVRR